MTISLDHNNFVEYEVFPGKGDPIIMLPSLWLTAQTYRPLAEELAKKHSVILINLNRGESRYSSAPKSIHEYALLLSMVIGHLELDSYVLLGFSLSGIYASYACQNLKLAPKKLILVSSTIIQLQRQRAALFFAINMVRMLSHTFNKSAGRERVIQYIKDSMTFLLSHPKQWYEEVKIAISDWNLPSYSAMKIPTFLINGREDEFIHESDITKMNGIKGLHISIIEGNHDWYFIDKQRYVQEVEKCVSIK